MKMEKPYTVGDNLDAYILFCDFIEPKKVRSGKERKNSNSSTYFVDINKKGSDQKQ